MTLLIGSCVTHARMLELGSGEVVAFDGVRLKLHFASGDRSFVFRLAEKHLQLIPEAPTPVVSPVSKSYARRRAHLRLVGPVFADTMVRLTR